MVSGKRYQVFSIKETKEKENGRGTVWVKAGSAWINRDGSMNVYLDVLPIDGRLHVREALEKREASGDVQAQMSSTNGSSELEAMGADSMGGH